MRRAWLISMLSIAACRSNPSVTPADAGAAESSDGAAASTADAGPDGVPGDDDGGGDGGGAGGGCDGGGCRGDDGGDHGDPDGGARRNPLACDDRNPCTDDRLEGGICRSAPVEDGWLCEDGNLCTLGDRCGAGRCLPGALSAGPLQQLGSLGGLRGGAVGVGADRFLMFAGVYRDARLDLVRKKPGGLERLATWRGHLSYFSPDELIAYAFDSGLVAYGERGDRWLSFVKVSAPSLDPPATIEPQGKVDIDGQLISMTGHGKRAWMCTGNFFNGYAVELVDVSDPDQPVLVGRMPLPTDCGSVAASEDGKRVYVNTREGVRFIDASPLDTGGDPTLSEPFTPTAGVSTAGPYLVLRGPNAVRVLRQSGHAEVVSVPVARAKAATLLGERLLVEAWRTVGGGMEEFLALFDVLGPNAPAQLDEVVVYRVSFIGDADPWPRSAPAKDGSAVITRTGPRMFDLSSGRFVDVRVPELVPLGQLSHAPNGVRAIAPGGSAVIDVKNPRAPAFVGGGSFGLLEWSEGIALDETWSRPQLVGRSEDPGQVLIRGSRNPYPINRWRFAGDGSRQATGSFSLPNSGDTQLLLADGALYGLRLPVSPSSDVTLQGWSIRSLGSAGELARPDLEVELSPSPPLVPEPTGAYKHFGAFDVDPRTGIAVVTIGVPHLHPDPGQGALFWLDLTTFPPRVLEEVHVSFVPKHVRVAGTRAMVTNSLAIHSFERGKGLVSSVDPGDVFIDHLLAFDGRIVYFAQSSGRYGLGTAVFGATGPPPEALILGDLAQSLVVVDSALVLGLESELVTIHPQCQ